ncbi:MAG: alanine--tRNA ligase [Oscillospiraceae bacterium]|jgi:alanyl-tRNA synthetase|nr:alanine--tRNA ligase [Oscillospiraceae bacterium]
MKQYGLNELREMFLSFFESKGHLRLPSFSLVPQGDNSLLLINSGMAPMKPWFKGETEPPRLRVTTCQKCMRTGDLENVGKTARHGTYFEMLGNFSFGDYFKSEAVAWCWEFLTVTVGLPAELLYPSVYEQDDEAFEIWNKQIGIPAEKITRLGKADNFWEHGQGPCGPCSEVYFDRGEQYGCGSPDCGPGCDCDRFIEIWNNVFTQFDNDGAGNYTELKQKNIDTGMGLERLAVVCQGVNNLFEVDTIVAITKKISECTGAAYGQSAKSDVSLRIITDHIRAAVMMISDGVLPSNEGRGYVLRRLLRRAARNGRLLGQREVFLARVAEVVIENNKNAYPEVAEHAEFILKVVRAEEESFSRTLESGLAILDGFFAAAKTQNSVQLAGKDVFLLYDTYGFPYDLTEELAAEAGLTLDRAGFDAEMQAQRERARKARAETVGDVSWEGFDFGDTQVTEFTGYNSLTGDAAVINAVSDGEVSAFVSGEGIIVLDKSPFYAEMGGQSGDSGRIVSANGDTVFVVDSTRKSKGGKFLHSGRIVSGKGLAVGDSVTAEVDTARRQAIQRAHSATHLLQEALVSVLGTGVHQAGSAVEPDRLRFDFTHFQAMTPEEVATAEDKVNAAILAGSPVEVREMPVEEAKKLGATALFGEKYGETVRVVSMGDSMEFCGGTHLTNTAQAGSFIILSESSISSGVRRIEAVCGAEAYKTFKQIRTNMIAVASVLGAQQWEDVKNAAEKLIEDSREQRLIFRRLQAAAALSKVKALINDAPEKDGIRLVSAVLDENADDLKAVTEALRSEADNVAALLAIAGADKISFAAVCGKAAIAKGYRAGDIIKKAAAIAGGSGGGKPEMAMGGGKEVGKLSDAVASILE